MTAKAVKKILLDKRNNVTNAEDDNKYEHSKAETFFELIDIQVRRLLGAGVFGDGLGAFRHGVFGQLSGQKETNGGLDFAGGDGGLLVVLGETRGFRGDALEDVVDEGVHNGHGLGGDSGVGMDLLQHLVDVHRVRLLSLLSSLGIRVSDGLLRLSGLLHGFTAGLGRHRGCGCLSICLRLCLAKKQTLRSYPSVVETKPTSRSHRSCLVKSQYCLAKASSSEHGNKCVMRLLNTFESSIS